MNLKTIYLIKSTHTQNEKNSRQKHKMGTYEIDKISLICFDDKRFVLDDGIHTLAYFQKKLKIIDSHR